MSNTDFALAIEDLTVSFDGFKAIDDLTLYIDKNELRVIIGPNGAGKTTLLDLICGKTRATGGSIKFKNEDVRRGSRTREILSSSAGIKIDGLPKLTCNIQCIVGECDILTANGGSWTAPHTFYPRKTKIRIEF